MDPSSSTMVVTYLEMCRKPGDLTPQAAPPGTVIRRIPRPSIRFYRKLYRSVGERWSWVDRLRMDDETLKKIIQDPQVEIHLLLKGRRPLGYVEMDLRFHPDIELTYLGVVPAAIGKGMGKCLLDHAVQSAWRNAPRRLWLHTCTLDHPGALSFYLKNGFKVYNQEVRATSSTPQGESFLSITPRSLAGVRHAPFRP